MPAQDQFLEVIDRDEAERRFRRVVRLTPLGEELVPLAESLGRVLSSNVAAAVDVPSFDRSNFDGFAVRAADTFGATEEVPRQLQLLPETIATGVVPQREVCAGAASAIATGGMLPRGADAVVMVEHTDEDDGVLLVRRAVTPGAGVSFAGTDIGAGETVLRRGDVLTSRETGVLAAIGVGRVAVWRQPRVAIISTGDEIVAPGTAMQPGKVYDSNARIIADAVRELGGQPVEMGIVPDDLDRLRRCLHGSLERVRCGAVVRRNQQRRRRSIVPRGPRTDGSGNRRSWCGPETGKTDLPGRQRHQAGRGPAGFSHIGHLHVSRVRGPGDSSPGRSAA